LTIITEFSCAHTNTRSHQILIYIAIHVWFGNNQHQIMFSILP